MFLLERPLVQHVQKYIIQRVVRDTLNTAVIDVYNRNFHEMSSFFSFFSFFFFTLNFFLSNAKTIELYILTYIIPYFQRHLVAIRDIFYEFIPTAADDFSFSTRYTPSTRFAGIKSIGIKLFILSPSAFI